jgi:hypothetical protein
MLDHEIDRILRDDPGLTPSSGFVGRVMTRVHEAESERAALPFPWSRLLAGLAVCSGLTLAAILLGPRPDLQELGRAAAAHGLVAAGPWLGVALVLAFLPTWWSLRRVGTRV